MDDSATIARHSRPPVLADVARVAEVSVGTASKALNDRGRISDATRARVKAAAQSLDFHPNAAARGLLAGRTGTVGLLTNDLVGRFSLPVLMGAEDALGAESYSVLLCDARGDSIREQFHLRSLLERHVDGIILVGDSADPRPSLGRDLPVPVVYAYSPSSDDRDISVVTDDVGSGRLAVEHLLSLGRRRIAYVGGDADYVASAQRAQGVGDALTAARLSPALAPVFGSWSEEWGRLAAGSIIDRDASVDAIVCGSDQIARGVLDVLRDRGIDVPRRVSVVGHDNWEPIAAHARPALTSIDMRLAEIGRRAAEALFMSPDVGHSGLVIVPSRLEVRRTTA